MAEATTIQGVVRAVDGDEALVEVAQGGCGRCHEKGGCGGQHLSQMFCAGPKTYRVGGAAGVHAGETVTVAIAAGAVRKSANLAYGLPVLAMIAGATLGASLAGNAGAIAGCLAGGVAAWFYARGVVRSGALALRPLIVERSSAPLPSLSPSRSS